MDIWVDMWVDMCVDMFVDMSGQRKCVIRQQPSRVAEHGMIDTNVAESRHIVRIVRII